MGRKHAGKKDKGEQKVKKRSKLSIKEKKKRRRLNGVNKGDM